MPWCEPCGRYLTPNAVDTDGSCPSCGNAVDPAAGAEQVVSVDHAAEVDHTGQAVPWHFWVIVVLAGIYLGWRAVQGITLLF